MKNCGAYGCMKVVSNFSRLCDEHRSEIFEQRALETRESLHRQGRAKTTKGKRHIVESDPDYLEDSPRYDRDYDLSSALNRLPGNRPGETTALALEALAAAIRAKKTWTYAVDHREGRPGQTALIARIECIAELIGWPIELQPEAGSYRVQIRAPFLPITVTQPIASTEYKTTRRKRRK